MTTTATSKVPRGYSAITVPPVNRALLLKDFVPKYEKVIAHHVTRVFNLTKQWHRQLHGIQSFAPVSIYGYVDSLDGIEAFLVSVNGDPIRPDGNKYHITWSLDPKKYSPKDSNDLITECGDDYEKLDSIGFVGTINWIPFG